MENSLDNLTAQIKQRYFVELEASARHVHVTKEQAKLLFGHDLTEKRPLSQPGQFLANERVSVRGSKGCLDQVAVLGPCRKEAQVEISLTDGRLLGILPEIRLSGDIEGTGGAELIGPCGSVVLDQGVIAAQRHIHMTPEDAKLQKVRHGDVVRLKTMTARPVVFENVAVRVSEDYRTFAHLDFDEANACGFHRGDLGMIVP